MPLPNGSSEDEIIAVAASHVRKRCGFRTAGGWRMIYGIACADGAER